jgi:hypothetical protein
MSFHMWPGQLPDAATNERCFEAMMAFVDELKRSGSLVLDHQILPEPAIHYVPDTSGRIPKPSAMLGGFFVVTVKDHIEAVALAERCPHRQVGPISLLALNESEENAYRPDA